MLAQIINSLMFDYRYFKYFAVMILTAEFVLGQLIILKIPYTEIDWKAYMRQVEGFREGQLNYIELRGDTGPLVYPAGFLYIFTFFHWITDHGVSIWHGQQLFLVLYILTTAVMLGIYYRSKIAAPWIAILLCASRRIHSIFVLRLFNDTVAMLLAYVSILLLIYNKWNIGSLLYSAAVSVKMNVLLFAPGLLLLMLQSSGILLTVRYLAICAGLQLVLGAPFLYTNWKNYVMKAFEFGRVFMFKWSVNWKFLREDVFVSQLFALVLLCCQLLALVLFIRKWMLNDGRSWGFLVRTTTAVTQLPAKKIATVAFISNFVGIVFARTLHYQFYCWYFHTIPFLLAISQLHILVCGVIMYGIEFAFNVFPSTPLSSGILQICHIVILGALFHAQDRRTEVDANAMERIISQLNKDHGDMVVFCVELLGGISKEDAKGAKVIDVDPFWMLIRLEPSEKEIRIAFGERVRVDNIGEVRKVAMCMIRKAQTAVLGSKNGAVFTRSCLTKRTSREDSTTK